MIPIDNLKGYLNAELYYPANCISHLVKKIITIGNDIVSNTAQCAFSQPNDVLPRLSNLLCYPARQAMQQTHQAFISEGFAYAITNRRTFNLAKLSTDKAENDSAQSHYLIVPLSSLNQLYTKTVSPCVAVKLMHKIDFNGYGEIIKFKKPLRLDEYCLIYENLISPLSKTPEKHKEDIIRTPMEGLIDLASLIEQHNISPAFKANIMHKIKQTYLSGHVSMKTIQNFHDMVELFCPLDLNLLSRIKKVIGTIEHEGFMLKRNDNYYGRLFDSAFANYLIHNPSVQMKQAVNILRNEFLTDFSSVTSEEDEQKRCVEIAKLMKSDPPPWRYDIPEVKKFLKHPSANSFEKMLKTKNKYNHVLIIHLAVKYLKYSPTYGRMKKEATKIYNSVICSQRELNKRDKCEPINSQRTGILLPYQDPPHVGSFNAKSMRPIDRYKLKTKKLSLHDRLSAKHERALGIGMSGSANILKYFFNDLLNRKHDFNLEQAKLLTAAYMTFSGGHSINEAYTVFDYETDETDETDSLYDYEVNDIWAADYETDEADSLYSYELNDFSSDDYETDEADSLYSSKLNDLSSVDYEKVKVDGSIENETDEADRLFDDETDNIRFQPRPYKELYESDELAKKAIDHAYSALIKKATELNMTV